MKPEKDFPYHYHELRGRLRILSVVTAVSLLLLALTSLLPQTAAAQPSPTTATAVQLTDINPAQSFTNPIDIANAGDGRLFIVEQRGVIQVIASPYASNTAETFLDIQDRVASGGETGLLSLAFHPDYSQNGYFYVNYTHIDTENSQLLTRISRFQTTSNPNVADPGSETILLELVQPYSNHNGGDLAFAADGTLYASLGDGGDAGDPHDNGQTTSTLLGSVLRLNVDGGGQPPDCGGGQAAYTIPADNPLSDGPGGACDEIWAYGLRNPWRFSFDRATDDLFIGDVGQGTWEEVDYQPANSGGGENYGWRCYEGSHAYNTSGCSGNTAVYTFPIDEYEHTNGRCSITGGFVYRGNWYPALSGAYIFADYCSGEIWSLVNDGANWQKTPLFDATFRIPTFGEDASGELYLAGSDGHVYLLGDDAAADYLTITLDGPVTAVSGEPFTYTLTVNNTGVLTATNLTITNTLPSGATYISGGDAFDGQTISWNLPTLPPGTSQQVQWSASITQTVWNDQYGVTADNGLTAVGQKPVATLVNAQNWYFPIVMKPVE